MPPAQTATSLNSGTILLGFVAVLIGLGGTYAVRVYTQKPVVAAPAPPPPAPKPKPVTVPLASRDIPEGTTLTLDDVALYKMKAEEAQKYAGGNSFMTNPSQIIGKIAAREVKKGKTFTTTDFYPAGQRPNFASRLKPGFRAITLALAPNDALNGFATPGQNVDVLFHYGASGGDGSIKTPQSGGGNMFGHHDFNPPRRRDYYGNTIGGGGGGAGLTELFGDALEEATTTLVQSVEIMAIGTQSVPMDAAMALPDQDTVTVTVAVNPRQAELLNVAKGHGRLSLTLRGAADSEHVELLDPVTIEEIMHGEQKTHQMEIYRGKQLTRLHFDGGKILRRRVFDDGPALADDTPKEQVPNTYPPLPMPVPTFVPYWLPHDITAGHVAPGLAPVSGANPQSAPAPSASPAIHPSAEVLP